MTAKQVKDYKKVAKREGTFSTLARKEGKGAHERYEAEKKAGLKASAADSKREEHIDVDFAVDRKKVATAAKKQALKAGHH
jgi:hypothetical protein